VGSYNEILNNQLNSNSAIVGVSGSGGRSVNYVIYIQGDNNFVQNNEISENNAQIYGGSRGTSNAYCYGIYNSGNFNIISENILYSNKAYGDPYPSGKYRVVYGIYSNGLNNSVLLNDVYDNLVGDTYGIFIYNSDYTMIDGNEASNNSEGIYLQNSFRSQLTNNTILNNSNCGVFLSDSGGNTLNKCSIWGNNKGLAVVNSNTNLIYDNYFNNTINTESDSSLNIWNTTLLLKSNIIFGPYTGGNVWANPDGTGLSQTQEDVNHNGISIFGYPINGENIDYLPLLLNYQPHTITSLPGQSLPPTDPDGDGLYEDLNGDGAYSFDDVVSFFDHVDWIRANEPIVAFDYNGNGDVGFEDIVGLYDRYPSGGT
jgi:parallel beta-helix repeat protein